MANSIFKVHEMINKVGFEFDDATAKKVTQLAEKAGKLAADNMTQELSSVVAEIGGLFNQALAKLGKEQIDLSDMIKMPDSSTIGKLTDNFVSQIAGNISEGITAGINNSLEAAQKQLNELEQKRASLFEKREKTKKSQSRWEEMSGIPYYDVDEFPQLKARKDIDSQAQEIMSAYDDSLEKLEAVHKKRQQINAEYRDSLKQLESAEVGTPEYDAAYNNKAQKMEQMKAVTKEYNNALLQAAESYKTLMSMASTISANIESVNEQTLQDFNPDVLKGITKPFLQKYTKDMVSVGEKAVDSLEKTIGALKKEINEVDIVISQLRENMANIIPETVVKSEIDKIKQIEEAYDRLAYKSGANKGKLKKPENIEAALNYAPGTTSLAKLKHEYDKADPEKWEQQYQAIVKFVREYEAYANSPNVDKERLKSYQGLYEQIKPMAVEAEMMLQNILNKANDIPFVGVSTAGPDMTSNVADETERAADAEHSAAEEAEKKRIADEAAAEAAEKERLAKEAIVNTNKQVVGDGASVGAEQVNEELTEQSSILTNIQKLTRYIDEEYLSAGKHLSDFLDDLQKESGELDTELKEILTTLRLIDGNGNLTFDIKRNGEDGGGTTHNGALISDEFVLIERGNYDKVKDSRLPDATQGAAKDGINVAEVLGYLPSKYTKGFFDVQGVAKGHNLFEDGVLSQDVVNATDEQLEQLTNAFIKARDYGFNIENGGSNIVYDKDRGFSFYDLEELSEDDAEFWNGLSESEKKLYALEDLFSLFSGLNRDHGNYADDSNVKGFTERIKSLIANKGIVDASAVDQSGRNYEDIYDDVFGGDEDLDTDDIIALLQAEAEAYKKNAEAKNADAQAQERLNRIEEQNPQTSKDVQQETISYDKLRQKVETYYKLRQKMYALMDSNQPWQHLMPDVDAAKKDITSLFPETGDKTTVTSKWVSNYLMETLDDEGTMLSRIAGDLGVEIPQAANTAKQAVDELNRSLEKQQVIENTDNDSAEVAEENTKTEAIKQQNSALKENIDLKAQANEPGVVAPAGTGTTGTGTTALVQSVPDGVVSTEITDLEAVRAKVLEVTDAVNAKTQAFKDEATAVNTSVESEITQLGELEQKITNIKATLEDLLNNIQAGQGSIDAGLSNIIVNVNHAETPQNDLSPVIDAISRISLQPTAVTDVGNVLATENTLSAIKTAVESINNKVQQGIRSETVPKAPLADDNKAIVRYEEEADSKISGNGGPKPTEKINTALTALLKYKTTLQEANQLSGDLENGINDLYAELSQVSDKESLAVWSEHFKQFKNASSIIQTLVKDYQILGELQAKADAETDPTKLEHYLDNIQILQDRIDIKSVDVNVNDDRFAEAYQRAYNIERHEIQQKQELADANQVEAEVIKRLVKLYEQLGRARATGNMMEVTRVRGLIRADRSQLASVDYATDMKFKAARDKGYNDEQAKAENLELKEQESIISNLINLYQKFGNFKERAANADEGMSEFYNNEAKKIESQIIAETQKLGIISDALQQRFDDAYSKGKDIAQSDILKTLYAGEDKDRQRAESARNKDVAKLVQSYERLGRLQTEYARTGSYKTEHDISVLKDEIAAETTRLGLTREQIAALETRRNIARVEAEESLDAEEREKIRLHYIKEEEKALKKRMQQEKQLAQKEAMVGPAGSAIRKAENTWITAMSMGDMLPPELQAQMDEYYVKLDQLRRKQAEVKNSDTISEEQKAELIQQTQNVSRLTKEFEELLAEYQRLSGDNVKEIGVNVLGNGADMDAYKKQLSDAVMTATSGKAQIQGFDAATKTLTYTVQTGKNEFTQYTAAVRNLDGALVSVQGQTKKTETFFEGLRRKTKEIWMYLGGSTMIYKVFAELKKGIQYVREIDSALTELKKVTNETEETYERFLNTAAKTADKVGSTIKEVVSSTADWARIGYNLEEAATLAESTAVLLNVSEFQSIDDATSALTSTLQAFGYTANQSMDVVDVLNEVGNNFAISSDGIATALQDSASSLMAANNSYEQAVALIAAANRVVQDPNSVGAALRTISLRLRGTSIKELEESGEDTTGAVESSSKLRSKVKSLSGVDILTDTGAYKDTYTILLEISKVWKKMSDIDQAALLELIAGKTRSNTAAAILSNTKDLEAAYQSAMDAEGSALAENETYLDSIQGRIDLFNNSVQTMWKNTIESDVVKRFVNLGTEIVKIIDKIGLLNTIIGTLILKSLASWALKATTSFTGWGAALSAVIKWMLTASGSSKTLGVAIANLTKVFKAGEISAGGFASGVGSLILKAPITKILAIAAAIGVVVTVLDNLWPSAEKASKKAREFISEYTEAQKTLQSHSRTINNISEDYQRLADGVDSAGNNISLTTDEYARYNEIANQIADMFPAMIAGYTEEGNAILKLKGNIEALTEAQEKEAAIARNKILQNSNDVFESAYLTAGNGLWGSDGFWKDSAQGLGEIFSFGIWQEVANNKEILKLRNYMNGDAKIYGGDRSTSAILQSLKEAGADVSWWEIYTGSKKAVDRIIKENRNIVQLVIDGVESEIAEQASNAKTVIDAYLDTSSDYDGLPQSSKNLIAQVVQNLDDEFVSSFSSNTEAFDWVERILLNGLGGLDGADKAQLSLAFDLQTKFNNDDVDVATYENKIQEFIDLIDALDLDNEDEILKSIRMVFNVDDNGEVDVAKQNVAKELLDDYGDAQVKTFTQSDLDIINQYASEWKLDDGTLYSYDELKEKIEEVKQETLSAAVAFDEVSGKIDNIQNAYSTLTDVVEQYNSTGYLTLDNLQALLSLEPEYLAVLQMENGQLSINQQAMEAMLQAQLAKAEATVVDTAITQLNTLSERAKEEAIVDSANAAGNAVSVLSTYASQLSTVGQEAIIAAGKVSAFNAAVDGAVAAGVSLDDINAVIRGMNAQFAAIDSVRTNLSKNFTNIVNPKTSSSSSDSALDKLQKKYERKIANLENQQTYLENEIATLEAKGEGVSRQYYEKQIEIEEQKLALYEQQRKELSALLNSTAEGSDEWWEIASSLWEVEHAIQEATLNMIEFRKSIVELYKTAFDDIADAYGNKDSVYDDRKAIIEGYAELLELQNKLVPVNYYKQLMALEELDKQNNIAMLEALQAQYNRLINSAEYKEGTLDALQAAIDMQAQMRATEKAILDNDIALAQFNEDLKNLYVEGWDKVMEAFSNKDSFFENQQNFADAYISRLEALNINVPDSAYDKMIEIQRMRQQNTEAQLEFARQELATLEQELGTDDPAYFEKYSEIVELEQQLYEGETQILEWQQKIIQNQFERFNKVVDRINDSINELQNISGLISDKDVATEDGEWTDEGLTQLGLSYQQMAINKKLIEEYGAEIDELTRLYNAGEISEETYYERLQELSDGQWDAINAYKDAEDAIIDLNEARIDMIEEGINKEIEAYQELIDLKKEELDAERDLYDFRQDVQKQTKDIAALERRIASMSGSTDASTIAERTKLEAQLREARAGLTDTYYNYAIDSQSKALEDEMEFYQDNQMDYLEKLRESIKDTDKIIEDTYQNVLSNGDTVLKTLAQLSSEYGFTVSANLTTPWEKGSSSSRDFAAAAAAYVDYVKLTVYNATSPLTENLAAPWNMTAADGGPIYTFSEYVAQKLDSNLGYAQSQYNDMKTSLSQPWLDSQYAVNTFSQNAITQIDKVIAKAKEAANAINNTNTTITTPDYSTEQNPGTTGGGGGGGGGTAFSADVKALQEILNDVFSAGLKVDGYWGPKTEEALKNAQAVMTIAIPSVPLNGKYDKATRNGILKWIEGQIINWKESGTGSSMYGQAIKKYTEFKKKLPAAFHAKGTLGTKKDEWAITDESWIGEEITLAAGKNGQLQYLKKGSAVMPADISANLVEWGKINPNMMNIGGGANLNMINNAVNKPEFKFEIAELLHVDRVDQDTLPALEKMMDKKIDTFAKQLNASIRQYK